ncbi:MAG: tRNA (guanosine(46)-N7)-methyltransferase TrmB [Bacillota bacterium]
MRRRKKPGAKEKLLAYHQLVVKDTEGLKGKWNEYFDNENRIHVELGTGRGQFITSLAEQNPEINFIGIEIKEEVLLRAVQKAEEKGLKNIAFLWYDVNHLTDVFSHGEIDRLYINFCDPWPKKRWGKRRLTHRNFLEVYRELLGDHGEIHFKTDNEKLFEFTLNELSYSDYKLKNIIFDLHHSDFQGNITTEYEDKFAAVGMKIYHCQARKRN